MPFCVYNLFVYILRQAIMHPDKDANKQKNRITSYKGLFSHFDCHKMTKRWSR